MAVFVHIADQRDAPQIRRGGIQARKAWVPVDGSWKQMRVVFCVPVVPSFQATFQWLRELKRGGYRTSVGVQFRIPDSQQVLYGYYGKPHELLTAAEATSRYLNIPDPRGWEVLLLEKVAPTEIMKIRDLPQLVGWRFFPKSKNTGCTWWPTRKGELNRWRVVASINRKDNRERRLKDEA